MVIDVEISDRLVVIYRDETFALSYKNFDARGKYEQMRDLLRSRGLRLKSTQFVGPVLKQRWERWLGY